MSDVTTLSAKYQIASILLENRRELRNWKPGQQFAFIPEESGVLLVPVPTIEDLRGAAKGATITNYRDREDRY